jgi:hypothetical protein
MKPYDGGSRTKVRRCAAPLTQSSSSCAGKPVFPRPQSRQTNRRLDGSTATGRIALSVSSGLAFGAHPRIPRRSHRRGTTEVRCALNGATVIEGQAALSDYREVQCRQCRVFDCCVDVRTATVVKADVRCSNRATKTAKCLVNRVEAIGRNANLGHSVRSGLNCANALMRHQLDHLCRIELDHLCRIEQARDRALNAS